jgi:hypothetical protein
VIRGFVAMPTEAMANIAQVTSMNGTVFIKKIPLDSPTSARIKNGQRTTSMIPTQNTKPSEACTQFYGGISSSARIMSVCQRQHLANRAP